MIIIKIIKKRALLKFKSRALKWERDGFRHELKIIPTKQLQQVLTNNHPNVIHLKL